MKPEDRERLQGIPRLNGTIGKTHELEEQETLEEFLKQMHPLVCVGITAGASYIYLGTVKGFLEEGAAYADFLYTRQKAYSHLKALASGRAKNFVPHIPILHRIVKSYSSRQVPGEQAVWVLTIEGNEMGGVWLMSEMQGWYDSVRKQIAYKQSMKDD